jgi:4-diphosphocytidyl-2-C-methyl-D-erythritol kinase
MPITVAAPAKLNLYLHVLGRRADGYHLLDSLVAFAGAADLVEVRPARGLSLRIEGPMAPALAGEDPEANLVLRAARLLAGALGRPADAGIVLVKRLPVAAGVGGGSADAAAALQALARLWGVAPDDPLLAALAPRLGADVPVCLAGRAAFFGGIGEELAPAPPLPPAWAVLVNPGVPVPTPAVFAARVGPFSAPARFAEAPADCAGLARLLAARGNDLMPAAVALAPVVETVLERLAASPGCLLARMSGSGATCFGLFADAAAARDAAGRLAAAHPDWWVEAARLIG